MHAQFNTISTLACYPEMFDPEAKFRGITDVINRNTRYPFGINLVKCQRDTKCNRRQDRQLVRRVNSLNIKRWISLGISQRLRLGQNVG